MAFQQIGLEIILLFILIIVNGLFSMSEIAIVSARKFRLQKRSRDGDLGARAALKIADTPDRFLSTVQIGITLVGVLSGAFGGAALAVHLEPALARVETIAPYARQLSFGLVVIVITYFSLVIGELIPKRIALSSPEKIAARVSRPMNLVSKLTAPFVWILSTSTGSVLRLFRLDEVDEDHVSEEEIKAIILQGASSGVLEETEQELMESITRLDDQQITALMIPRTKIEWINLKDRKAEIERIILSAPYSRLLAGNGSLDDISGFVKTRDVMNLLLSKEPFTIEKLVREPIFIPETSTILDVLEQFRDSSSKIAVVVDEFGSTHGIVTTNDILEAIVGDLAFRGVRNESAVRREDGSWLLDARLSNSEFTNILNISGLPEDEAGMYETLAGFIIKRLEKFPAIGDHFEWEEYTFEIVDMDGKRIDRVLVSTR
ncbi:MAG: hemolysin family protein [Pyrinomonadaceae bacterium]